ncbi:MAG: hypothetical protein LDL56_01315 [Armatimonadetes bacterium]|nr:hypothetical protein [Armatimonadota bacterium]
MFIALAAALAWQAPSTEAAHLGYFAETSLMRIAGFEMPDLPPGMEMPEMPGMAFLPGKPQRSLEIRLWSPGVAPKDAFAFVAPPQGLGQGPRLDLKIVRPSKGGEPAEADDQDAKGERKPPDFTIKIYWGSSPKVREGQPKVFRFKDLGFGQQAGLLRQWAQAQMAKGASDAARPDATLAHWPSGDKPVRIAPSARLAGTFHLETNYAGQVDLEVPKELDFLAPFDLASPDLSRKPDLSKALALQWKPIPTLLGTHAMIFGMQGQETRILWYAGETWDEKADVDWDFLQMAEVRRLVEQKVLLKGDATSATVPEGIFRGADFVMLRMTGYGPSVARADVQPVPRLQTKTTLMAILGGKMLDEME